MIDDANNWYKIAVELASKKDCLIVLWVAWRGNFSPFGIALGAVALFGGIMFLAPYLLYVSFQSKGDMKEFFTGRGRNLD